MKTLSQLINEAKKSKLDIQDDTINYIPADQLKKYLEIADKFISQEAKDIVNWLIVNNSNYISELSTDDSENALAGFYDAGVPKEDSLKELYKAIGIIAKNDRLLEIPVFQTKEQFESIINKKESPDAIILDLKSEAGRSKVAEKYKPLLIKMCKDWNGKSTLSFDELMSAGYEGLVWAMNGFGKKTDKNKVDMDTIVSSQTFGQYAAYLIRVAILEAIKNESHTVRIPISAQNRERKEKGYNTRSNSVSGDSTVSKDGEGGKTLFDFFGGETEDAESGVNADDLKKIRKELYSILDKEFGNPVMDAFYSFYGCNGHEKLKNKEIAAKYKISNSNVTYYCNKVANFIKKNDKVRELCKEMLELMYEGIDNTEAAIKD